MNKLKLQDININNSEYKVCSKCIYDERVSNISFANAGFIILVVKSNGIN